MAELRLLKLLLGVQKQTASARKSGRGTCITTLHNRKGLNPIACTIKSKQTRYK